MPAPLSPDIRNRFQVLYREALSAREIGRRLLISAATAVRFADRLDELETVLQRRTHGVVDTGGWYLTRASLRSWLSKIRISR